jgi:hypothetical protein
MSFRPGSYLSVGDGALHLSQPRGVTLNYA